MTLVLFVASGNRAWSDDATETIVLIRHGEKPKEGLGQLDCQGLNRALALPAVIQSAFGRPSAIYAPDPSQQKEDEGIPYDYVRPLATIEPTAISFGLPVITTFGFSNTDGVQAAIERPSNHNALVLISWEHKLIETIARGLLSAHGGDAALVPKWHGDDFDSMYIVTISWLGDGSKATFRHAFEGLNGQPTTCPN